MKLSKAQKRLLRSIRFEERDTDDFRWMELFPYERRSAKALARKGLVETDGDEHEVHLTPAGRVLADKLMEES